MSKTNPGNRKGQRVIQEILRLKGLGLSRRKIALALNCSRNTVDRYLDEQTEVSRDVIKQPYHAPWSENIDWPRIHDRTNKGHPLLELWETAEQQVPYVSFWREYRRRYPNVPLDFHKEHPPGERCEVDYKGDSHGLGYTDRRTGEFVPCRLFGAVLCFSQLFFPRATHTEKQVDLLESIAESYSYFSGVALTTIVDNAKAAVLRAHRYDPELNPEFTTFCEHFGTAPIATRPRKPKDKNLIENSLGVFWRWAARRVRERRCFSLGELNDFILSLADEFNSRIQRKYGLSRRQKFDNGEKAKLLVLPPTAYSFGEWRKATPHPDCHVQVGKNFYSVPYQQRGKEVEVRIGSSIVEVFFNLKCIARHIKASANHRGMYFTKDEHLPEAHRVMMEATPHHCLEEATAIGTATQQIISELFSKSRHPLMYLRRAQGILRLARRYSSDELEASCQTLIGIGTEFPRLKDIEGIITGRNKDKASPQAHIHRSPNPYLRGQKTWSEVKTI